LSRYVIKQEEMLMQPGNERLPNNNDSVYAKSREVVLPEQSSGYFLRVVSQAEYESILAGNRLSARWFMLPDFVLPSTAVLWMVYGKAASHQYDQAILISQRVTNEYQLEIIEPDSPIIDRTYPAIRLDPDRLSQIPPHKIKNATSLLHELRNRITTTNPTNIDIFVAAWQNKLSQAVLDSCPALIHKS
jgi:hypothetical protein